MCRWRRCILYQLVIPICQIMCFAIYINRANLLYWLYLDMCFHACSCGVFGDTTRSQFDCNIFWTLLWADHRLKRFSIERHLTNYRKDQAAWNNKNWMTWKRWKTYCRTRGRLTPLAGIKFEMEAKRLQMFFAKALWCYLNLWRINCFEQKDITTKKASRQRIAFWRASKQFTFNLFVLMCLKVGGVHLRCLFMIFSCI